MLKWAVDDWRKSSVFHKHCSLFCKTDARAEGQPQATFKKPECFNKDIYAKSLHHNR
jgi:hypothetical protein